MTFKNEKALRVTYLNCAMTKCLLYLLLLGHLLLVENFVSGLLPLGNAPTKGHPSQHPPPLHSVDDNSRRGFFVQQGMLILYGATLSLVPTASAAAAQQEEEGAAAAAARRGEARGGRPFAPLEALLPATRCKVWIDQAHGISAIDVVPLRIRPPQFSAGIKSLYIRYSAHIVLWISGRRLEFDLLPYSVSAGG